jgi:hypothetical protein
LGEMEVWLILSSSEVSGANARRQCVDPWVEAGTER